MSILIKGMEIPKSCWDCFACHDGWCIINKKIEGHRTVTHSCPLVAVPDHGRLIDADALEELFREVIGNISKRDEIKPVLEHMVRASAMAVEMIKDAPTIIPAEEGGEE